MNHRPMSRGLRWQLDQIKIGAVPNLSGETEMAWGPNIMHCEFNGVEMTWGEMLEAKRTGRMPEVEDAHEPTA